MSIRSNIPNLLTLGNLAMGCLAGLAAFDSDFKLAAIYASLALVLDFLDGSAARLLKVQSAIGKELDSLADVVSFGAVPALVLYTHWRILDLGAFGGISFASIALLLPLFAAYRLAKFNTTEQSTEYFKGLPTPALAIVSYSLPLVAMDASALLWMNTAAFAVGYTLLGCFLMVGSTPLLSYKLGSPDPVLNRARIASIALFILCLGFFKFFGLFLCLLMYLAISLSLRKQLIKDDI